MPTSTSALQSRFLSKRVILAIHRDQIEAFAGTHGIRDEGLLDSALAQPSASLGGRLLHRTIHDQAAAYLFHICSNHPFLDGNKRTAFAAMDTFLRLNGLTLMLTDDEAFDLTISVATGEATKRSIATVLRRATERR